MPPQPDGVWQTVYNGANWLRVKGKTVIVEVFTPI